MSQTFPRGNCQKYAMKREFPSKAKVQRARCKEVLVIFNNRLETVKLIREEIHPPAGDFADGPLELAVVRWHGLEVFVALECVMFLRKLPPEPPWIREARDKVEQELIAKLNERVKGRIPAGRAHGRISKRVTGTS